ncbi:MAG: hypothetical protein OXG87_05990 [Gemmatimonadetes bacterium]|nr:hypothetical protein [Gemmatimonadota bacterium]
MIRIENPQVRSGRFDSVDLAPGNAPNSSKKEVTLHDDMMLAILI